MRASWGLFAFVLVGAGCTNGVSPENIGHKSAAATATPVTWVNDSGVSISTNNLTKTGAQGWNAGASSSETISSEGYLTFKSSENDTAKMIGLSNGDSNYGYQDIDYAIYLRANGTWGIYEGGNYRKTPGTYAAGDTFTVSEVGGIVSYAQNGNTLYVSSVAPTLPLLVDTSLSTPGATLNNVTLTATSSSSTVFQNLVSVSASGNSLTKTGTQGWNGGASTIDSLSTDGGISFTTAENTTAKMAGLSNGDSNAGYQDIDFAWYLRANGSLGIYEDGSYVGDFGNYAANDTFQVQVNSNVVSYWHNGVNMYTSAATPTFPLLFDSSMSTVGGTLNSVTFSPQIWQNALGVALSSNNLTKTGSNGWNSGASTVATISGDGAAAFTTSENTTAKMAGLSNGDSTHGYSDIDFAWYMRANGTLGIYEGGSYVGEFGTYAANDTFKVQVASGVVTYWHNGASVYTSAATPTFPLLVDTSLSTNGATIGNVTLQ